MHLDLLTASDRTAVDDHADGLGGTPAAERRGALWAGEHIVVVDLSLSVSLRYFPSV